MSPRYIVVDYNDARSEDPNVFEEEDDLKTAEKKFEELSKENEDSSVILYDSEDDTVLKVTIKSEPILLVNAIEFARKRYGKSTIGNSEPRLGANAAASTVIGYIAERLNGGLVPGLDGAVKGHFIAPYYAVNEDGTYPVPPTPYIHAGLSGNIGNFIGRYIWPMFRGVARGVSLGTGVTQILKTKWHPNQCQSCNGTGLHCIFHRCPRCEGYGYSVHSR